jgi:hypothetical protein
MIYIDGTIRYAYLTEAGEPKYVHEALQDPKCCAAMDEEYQALLKNKTWHLVPSSCATNVIDCKWVYKVKRSKMVPWSTTKHVLLLRGSNKSMGLIIVIPLALW